MPRICNVILLLWNNWYRISILEQLKYDKLFYLRFSYHSISIQVLYLKKCSSMKLMTQFRQIFLIFFINLHGTYDKHSLAIPTRCFFFYIYPSILVHKEYTRWMNHILVDTFIGLRNCVICCPHSDRCLHPVHINEWIGHKMWEIYSFMSKQSRLKKPKDPIQSVEQSTYCLEPI
jgi:hypothetical protein